MKIPSCVKAYDIRGKLDSEITENFAFRLGAAFAEYIATEKAQAKVSKKSAGNLRVVIGADSRISSPALKAALAAGLRRQGVTVIDLGLCGTEEVYFATQNQQLDGGIMVTASHNPADYNGFKLVRELAKPLSRENGLITISQMMGAELPLAAIDEGRLVKQSDKSAYGEFLLQFLAPLFQIFEASPEKVRPIRIVSNVGNGAAGPLLTQLHGMLHERFGNELIQITPLLFEPDGSFPYGIPNPLLRENRTLTSEAVKNNRADIGLAWDGDFDRCFFFDEQGQFIEGYYIVGLLAEAFLAQNSTAKILHDPRLLWNTEQVVRTHGGTSICCPTGHGFIKAEMRNHDALYGGEMSAHHYFRDFGYCDSGMIPWLLVMQQFMLSDISLGERVQSYQQQFPASGEINRSIEHPQETLRLVQAHYANHADLQQIEFIDGLSMSFATWRFNLRCSNTEPLVRLNVEARGNKELMRQKTQELLTLIDG